MAAGQVNITLGTAGHIDHGKSALVTLLTGCRTDRLKEEIERGMSIELGFAPCKVGGVEVGIVDVPGHEHFIKTMVAGAAGIDAVIFVVAADDGVMPQTIEHLQILTLLGVRHGLVALTKIDRAARERVEEVRADLTRLLSGTFLEDAPVLPLSNVTGEGFDGFYEGLSRLVASVTPRRLDGLFRMPVERAFSVKGFGTVVSGIPVSGSASVGDELELLPSGSTGRIRGIEAYGQTAANVLAGQCGAIQFRHWDSGDIARGDVLAAPGCFAAREWFLCRLILMPLPGLKLDSGARVRFHTGTSDILARVYPLEADALVAGGEYLVQVNVDSAAVAAPGDRFVMRGLTPARTLGGGMIVEAIARRIRRNRPGASEDARERAKAVLDEAAFVDYALRNCPADAATDAEIAQRVTAPPSTVKAHLAALVAAGRAVLLENGRYMHAVRMAALEARVNEAVATFHEASPASAGMALPAIADAVGAERPLLTLALARLVDAGAIARRNALYSLSTHSVAIDDGARLVIGSLERLYADRAFAPPSLEEAASALGLDAAKVAAASRVLLEEGRLVRVAPEMFFHNSAVDTAIARVTGYIEKKGTLPSVDFKYLIDTSRKYAIPLLDYMDKIGVTLRIGNTRHLRGR